MRENNEEYINVAQDLYEEYLHELESNEEYNNLTSKEQRIYRIKSTRQSAQLQTILSILFSLSPAVFYQVAEYTENSIINMATCFLALGVACAIKPMVYDIKVRNEVYKLSKKH